MDMEGFNKFRELLIDNQVSVSELEYTQNNYDDAGNLIKESLPTITTDFCEIGLHEGEIYFVFIIDSKTFSIELFDIIREILNVKIYGLADFKKTLYPVKDFNRGYFFKQIKKDKYLQIQFDYKNLSVIDLFQEYFKLTDIFKKSRVAVVNQLKIDLTAKS